MNGLTAEEIKQVERDVDRSRAADREERILLSNKRRTSHWLHLVLTLLSGGLWLPVWLVLGIVRWRKNVGIDNRIRELG